MLDDQSIETLTESAVDQLLHDIVTNALKPAAKLRVADLKSRYQMGATPLREALSRLVSLGFVTVTTRRGYRVASASREDLEDITLTRQLIEIEALRRSIQFGGKKWEDGVAMAHARLERTIERACGQTGAEAAVEIAAAHREFHHALIAGCGSPRLIGLHDLFHDQARRYRGVCHSGFKLARQFLRRASTIAGPCLEPGCCRRLCEAAGALAQHARLGVSGR